MFLLTFNCMHGPLNFSSTKRTVQYMRDPQRVRHHPLLISDATLWLITTSTGHVCKIICIYGRINTTDHISSLMIKHQWETCSWVFCEMGPSG